MSGHKLTRAGWTWIVAVGWSAAGAVSGAPSRQPPVPVLTESQRAFLSNTARRAVRDFVLQRDPYEPAYVPSSINSLQSEALVRLRIRGFLLSSAAAGPSPIAAAVRDAALAAAQLLKSPTGDGFESVHSGGSPNNRSKAADVTVGDAHADGTEIDAGTASELLIEIELIGSAERIKVQGPWTEPRVVDPLVEPGIHGLVLIGTEVNQRICPTEFFTSDLVPAEALKRLAQNLRLSESQTSQVQLLRFRTVHWYEPRSGDNIVSLERGLTRVPRDAVTRLGLDEAVARLAEYMHYRQLESGLFAYQYEPGRDAYSENDNLVRQVGATAAMATDARTSGGAASAAAADLAIRYHLQGLTQVPGAEGSAFIATADGSNKLGVTALLCLAMLEHPDSDGYAETVEKLVNGMLWLQRPSGMFLTAFPPAFEVKSQDYFPGEALLALATYYQRRPSGRIMDAFDRAATFYRDFFQGAPSPAFVPWQVQSFAMMARQSGRKDFADYVFQMSDWLADRQLDAANCAWEDLWGGIAAYSDGRAGVATAAYLEGFAETLALARARNDVPRTERYEHVVRSAARFVLQLQFREQEAYFVCSPRDAVGGIRTNPSLNLLRIDHCQHALVGLSKARQVLFGE